MRWCCRIRKRRTGRGNVGVLFRGGKSFLEYAELVMRVVSIVDDGVAVLAQFVGFCGMGK